MYQGYVLLRFASNLDVLCFLWLNYFRLKRMIQSLLKEIYSHETIFFS